MGLPILNLGSLNIDYVYAVPHFVRPGETLTALNFNRYAGGKGLNQSVALARAGARVLHAGAIGADGAFLRETLKAEGVDTSLLLTVDQPSGHAIIQSHHSGENCILLHGGANTSQSPEHISKCLEALPAGAFVLTQNETNLTTELLTQARARGFRVAWNPAPITQSALTFQLDHIDLLVLNEVEGAEFTGCTEPRAMLEDLAKRVQPQAIVVLTLGSLGTFVSHAGETIRNPATAVPKVVDTTAAGDTFIGYFLAALADQRSVSEAIQFASRAAALCIQCKGAAPSIPTASEVEAFEVPTVKAPPLPNPGTLKRKRKQVSES